MHIYFAPFITASCRKALSNKEIRDLSPDINRGIHLVPQLPANNVTAFTRIAEQICAYGYDEINLNLGCPSKTVVTKKKGAGLLAYLKSAPAIRSCFRHILCPPSLESAVFFGLRHIKKSCTIIL